jgi:hypothetical protein
MKRQYTRRTAKTAKVAPKRPGIVIGSDALNPQPQPETQPRPELPPLSPAILKTLADVIDLILS